jgi:hypothetical protein
MTTRIYKTLTPTGARLVRAANRAQAIAAVARDIIQAEVATQDDLVALLAQGVKVEESNADA